MDADKFNEDLEGLCKKHNLNNVNTVMEDLSPYKCATLAGGHHKGSICPIQTKRGGTSINMALYTADSLVIKT